MIESIRLNYFKAFKDSQEISLKPLTCLLGRNSSGKSSIINALLVLKQTIEGDQSPHQLPQLVLNGPLYEGGQYEDIVFNHDKSNKMTLSFSLKTDISNEFFHKSLIPPVTPRFRRYSAPLFVLQTLKKAKKNFKATVSITYQPEGILGPSLSKVNINIPEVGRLTCTRTSGAFQEEHWRIYTQNLPPKVFELRYRRTTLFPRFDHKLSVYKKLSIEEKNKANLFQGLCEYAAFDISNFLNSIRIVGPFRTPPERRYIFTGSNSYLTGLSGEQAINLLLTESLMRKKEERYLSRNVSFWLKHLKLADAIDVSSLVKKSNIFEINLNKAGYAKWANFADVGFGISQVLPVLVQGLLMEVGATYIVEQPEIHLHPDAQAGLADFFLFLASTGVRCIVETHSEYFIVRLRRRLAEKRIVGHLIQDEKEEEEDEIEYKDINTNNVSILLLDYSSVKGNYVRNIKIGPAFQYENLPKDFMNQAIEDRMKLLKAL